MLTRHRHAIFFESKDTQCGCYFIRFFGLNPITTSAKKTNGNSHRIHFGFIKKEANGKYVVYKDTRVIPLVPKQINPDYLFGAIIELPIGQHKCRVDIKMPKQNIVRINPGKTDLHTHIPADVDIAAENMTAVKGSESDCEGAFKIIMAFDESDSPGQFTLDIFVDNELNRLEFSVVK